MSLTKNFSSLEQAAKIEIDMSKENFLFCSTGLICVSVLECNTLFELREKTRGWEREREGK